MKTNLVDPVRSGKGATIIIKEFLFDNNFWNSKDRNVIIFFFIIGITIFSLKVWGNETNEEVINRVKQEYNQIRKEYYESDSITIDNLENEIKQLSAKKDILSKCKDYNYAHYDTVVSPINCENILDEQMKIMENWRVNKDGQSQSFIPIISNGIEERTNELLLAFGRGEDVLENRWSRVAAKYNIKTPVLVCIAKADSSLGKALKTANNFGNVGNNDRGDKVHFATAIQGIEAIAQTLNNKYLGEYNKVKDLSRYGNKEGKIYASSPDNWHNNVINCLSSLYGEKIDDDFLFRN